MRAVSIVAAAAVSALGRGLAAQSAALSGAHADVLAEDAELAAHGIKHALVGRVRDRLPQPELDRATRLLLVAAHDLRADLEARMPDFRSLRVAVIVGTTSGAMQSMESAFACLSRGERVPLELAKAASYSSPVGYLLEALGLPDAPSQQVLAACASSTLAIGLGCRWLEAGHADLVLAGGYDALSAFVTAGFDALGALTRSQPRPFHPQRDGMALGEGAALVALARAPARHTLARVLGFGSSSDAVHVTAPDREGRGLHAAAVAALADAGIEAGAVDFVSAHATATPYNDAAEAKALHSLFGERSVPVQTWKAVIGHTLGAAGVLETLAATEALRQGRLPPHLADLEAGIASGAATAAVSSGSSLRYALKLSAAFGGLNAALVLGSPTNAEPGAARPQRGVRLTARGPFVQAAEPELLARLAPDTASRTARVDTLSELVLAAVARLLSELPERPGSSTAVIVGSACVTLEVNEAFDRRRRTGQAVEPRRFPATSPNLAAGLCSIAFGFRGPALCVTPNPYRDAALMAYDLIALGDVDSAIVVTAEDAGAVVEGFCTSMGRPWPRRGATATWFSANGTGELLSRPDWAQPDAFRTESAGRARSSTEPGAERA